MNVYNSFPPGILLAYVGATAPDGFFICDGSSKLVADYPALFTLIGYTYGGSGLNFNIPDMQGRSTIGVGTASGGTVARVRGTKYGTDSQSHSFNNPSYLLPTHYHSIGNGSSMNTAGESGHKHPVYDGAGSSMYAVAAIAGSSGTSGTSALQNLISINTGNSTGHTHAISSGNIGHVNGGNNGDSGNVITPLNGGGSVVNADPTHPVLAVTYIIKY